MLQIALSEGLHIWKDIKPSRNTNKNSLKPKEECNCNYFGRAHPMLNPPRRLPKTTKMSPSPGAHGGAREEAEHAKKRCPAVASDAAKKISGLCVVFHKPHLHIVRPVVPLQIHPNTHDSQDASQQGSTLRRKRREPKAKLAFCLPSKQLSLAKLCKAKMQERQY